MSKGTAIDLGLTGAYNDLFSTQEERDNAGRTFVTDLDPAKISDFPNHPFHVRMDEEMERLVESVKERGVLSPVLVRPMPEGGYQMVSGHRRKMAAELAELPTVSCIVRELTDDEAVIIMVDSNLQRERVLPSEKAFAYQMKLDAMKRQGQRTDLTSAEGAVIVLACIIFSVFASSPPAVDPDAAAASMVWSYIGELVFHMRAATRCRTNSAWETSCNEVKPTERLCLSN